MPASVHQIDFTASRDRSDGSTRLHLARSKVIFFAPETAPLSSRSPIPSPPSCQHHEAIAAVLLALTLHVTGYVLMPYPAPEEPVTPPAPIQVSWISAPQPKAEQTPAAPPKRQPPTVKPKAKPKTVKRVKTQPKAVLSTSAPATTMTAAPAEKAEKTPKLAAAAPAAKPQANAAQTAAAPATTSQQPLMLPNLNADYLHNPAPRYPEDARERGEQGKVLVRALIHADGTVAELALRKSSGFTGLDQSALETVKKWRFVPARRGGDAVSAWVVVPITFSLEG
ncbi:energy transducer TonB [Methylomicrobium lacus]|uniref:energy transducer TonB n=1 Tax=Methylomicrobium lacus TaxID=136992 RepID=UPI0035A8292D